MADNTDAEKPVERLIHVYEDLCPVYTFYTVWDISKKSGCGIGVRIPVDLLEHYTQVSQECHKIQKELEKAYRGTRLG